MNALKAPFSHKLELALARSVMFIFRVLPHRKSQAFAAALGGFFHDVIGIRKKVAREHIAFCFPDKDEKWVRKTAREAYQSMAIVVAETARLPVLIGEEFKKWVVFEGLDIVDEILASGKGGLIASCHIGCWEYNGAWTANEGYPVTFVVAQQSNNFIDKLVDDIRKTIGIEIVKRDARVTRGILSALKRNRLIAMMMDQDARSHGVFVPFFGKLASTHKGVALLALKTGSPVATLTSRRLDDGRIRCTIRKVEFEPSGDKEKDVYDLTAKITRKLEADIKESPGQYLWAHKRWKTRPPEETGRN